MRTLYRYYDLRLILLYVGITWDLRGRSMAHRLNSEWWTYVAHRSCEHVPPERALAAERAAIENELPVFNRAGVPELARLVRREWYLGLHGRLRIGLALLPSSHEPLAMAQMAAARRAEM